jgi:hypothetical protein
MSAAAWTALAPFVVLAGIYGAYVLATRSFNVYRIAEGADGRASTSKAQFLLWTAVVVPCYAALFVANWRGAHAVDAGLGVPSNLMAALGISVMTTTGAKALYLVGSAPKQKAGATSKGGLLTDDAGYPDLAKIQLLAWTLLAVGIFCVRVADHIQSTLSGAQAATTLPDVDTALLVLMGIGHAGYTAKKALDRVQPQAQPLVAAADAAGEIEVEAPPEAQPVVTPP